jgi:hypothetical protein
MAIVPAWGWEHDEATARRGCGRLPKQKVRPKAVSVFSILEFD